MNKTKIIATLGPGTESKEKIVELIQAGMNVARINLSHGDRDSHARFIELVKQARRITGTYSAILLDTRGPEIRVSDLKEPLMLQSRWNTDYYRTPFRLIPRSYRRQLSRADR